LPYLNLDLDYFTHPKIMRLSSLLGPSSVMYPVKLWCYAAKHFPVTGMLEECSKHDIEMALGWDGEPEKLVDTLVKISLLEVKNSNYKIHDWKEHAGHLWAFKKRAKTAAKKRWKDYASSTAPSNAKGCAPNLSSPNLASSSLHLQKDSEKKEEELNGAQVRPKAIRGSVFPEGFQFDERADALAKSYGLNPHKELAAFRDFHIAKGSVFKDWPAAFRTWLRNAVKFAKKGTP
jgi:hypothetical protein